MDGLSSSYSMRHLMGRHYLEHLWVVFYSDRNRIFLSDRTPCNCAGRLRGFTLYSTPAAAEYKRFGFADMGIEHGAQLSTPWAPRHVVDNTGTTDCRGVANAGRDVAAETGARGVFALRCAAQRSVGASRSSAVTDAELHRVPSRRARPRRHSPRTQCSNRRRARCSICCCAIRCCWSTLLPLRAC